MAAIASADRRLLEGCYQCLLEARDVYASVVDGPAAAFAAARRFDAQLLIVLREKELSIDTGTAMRQLRDAAAVVADAGTTAGAIALVGMVAPNPAGLSDVEFSSFMRDSLAQARLLDGELEWLAASAIFEPVREYLALSVQCSPVAQPLLSVARRRRDTSGKPDDPPVVALARTLCASDRGLEPLEILHETTPSLSEAAYALARTAPMAKAGTSSTETRTLAAEALRVLPQSPAVTYLMAAIEQTAGNCQEALRLYDATLTLRSRHENAQLGRVACLSHLGRPDEAIAAATMLIDWQSTNLREAFYWRAHNRHILRTLDPARQDIARSKQLGSTVDNHTLAGIIAYEQDDLDAAFVDLERGWALGAGRNCTSVWYQGLAHVKREAWAGAAPAFERAAGCYARDLADVRAELAAMELRTDLDAASQQARIRQLGEVSQRTQRRRWDAAINAANCFVRSDDFARASPFIAIAAEDPTLAMDVSNLRTIVAAKSQLPIPPRR